MQKTINKVLIITNSQQSEEPVLGEVKSFFEHQKIIQIWYDFNGKFPVQDLIGVELAISLGGDGTLLYCAGVVAPYNIPILAINLGYLGFITEINKTEWLDAYEGYLSGQLTVSERTMIGADVWREGIMVYTGFGLNDVVIGTTGISKLVLLKFFLSDCYAGRYRADGVIIATPTGSTAYSMGAGGPIIHPDMDAFVLTPICPFTLSNRPLVVPGSEHIEIEVEDERHGRVALSIDGKEEFPLYTGDRVSCRRYEHKCQIICSNKRIFYEVLRAKLNWSGEPTNA